MMVIPWKYINIWNFDKMYKKGGKDTYTEDITPLSFYMENNLV